MMGMAMSPEMMKDIQAKVAERKAAVQASLGADAVTPEAPKVEPKPEKPEKPAKPEIDDKTVLDYIMSRQAAVDEARRECRALQAKVDHLNHELAIANTKVKALQGALAKVREEKKALEDAAKQQ